MEEQQIDPPVVYQRVSALVVAIAVGLGAYGAHGLEASEKGLASWRTAVLYHLVHGVVLYFLSIRTRTGLRCCPNGPWWCFLIGVLLFSGLLYTNVLTGVRWLGAIVPVGGLSFIIGWLWLAVVPDRKKV
jgi:uncharacterized membrane protein YgdD (TMEM256/DUF423 family)